MTGFSKEALARKIKAPKFRSAFLESAVKEGIALQIRLLRSQRDLTQTKLAKLVNTDQASISRWESPSTANMQLNKLLGLADALGVALNVEFVGYDEFLRGWKDRPKGRFDIRSYEELEDEIDAWASSTADADANAIVYDMRKISAKPSQDDYVGRNAKGSAGSNPVIDIMEG